MSQFIGLIGNGNKSDLVSIDENTGITTLIATLDSVPSYSSNAHALNPQSGKLVLWSSNFSETGNRLYTIDTQNGQVIINDNMTGEFWGLEHSNLPLSNTDFKIYNEFIVIYPNPSPGRFTLELNDVKSVNEILINDAIGRIVDTKLMNSFSTAIELEIKNEGIYYVSFISNEHDQRKYLTKKIIMPLFALFQRFLTLPWLLTEQSYSILTTLP